MAEQSENTGTFSKLGNLFGNKDVMKIALLLVAFGGIAIYFSKKNNSLKKQIEELTLRVDEQEEKLEIILKHVGGNVLGIPQASRVRKTRPVKPQPPSQPQQTQKPFQAAPQPHSQPQPMNPLSFLSMFIPSVPDQQPNVRTAEVVEEEDVDKLMVEEMQELKDSDEKENTTSNTAEVD